MPSIDKTGIIDKNTQKISLITAAFKKNHDLLTGGTCGLSTPVTQAL